MTNKEAIEELKKVDTLDMPARLCEAHYMAIKALEQEPSGETVSLGVFKQVMWERDIAIEQLKELGYGFGQKIEPQESDHKCHTCKHYTSGEYDGSCGSYICKGYSNWESEGEDIGDYPDTIHNQFDNMTGSMNL